jgi:hypothetical protein
VQPLVIRAHLVVSPSPTCTGITTVLDASGSQTPNLPITRYRFTYVEVPGLLWENIAAQHGYTPEEYLNILPVHVLSDGSNSRPNVMFTWNRKWSHEFDFGFASEMSQEYVRDQIWLTLAVTDLAGATAKTSQFLSFGANPSFFDQYSGEGNHLGESRKSCPGEVRLLRLASLKLVSSRMVVLKTSVASAIRCLTVAPCAGAISIFSARSFVSGVNSKAKTKRKPLAIASSPFFSIAAHHSSTIRAKLTNAGRALLRRNKTVKVIVQLTSITPAGRATTRLAHATLRRK